MAGPWDVVSETPATPAAPTKAGGGWDVVSESPISPTAAPSGTKGLGRSLVSAIMQSSDPVSLGANLILVPTTGMNARDYALDTLGHVPESAGHVVSNTVDAILDPVGTIKTLGKAAVGGLSKLLKSDAAPAMSPLAYAAHAIDHTIGLPEGVEHARDDAEKTFGAVADMYRDKYGSVPKALDTLRTDPVGTALDVSTVAAPAGAALKAAPEASALARAGEAITRIDPAAASARAVKAGVSNTADAVRALSGRVENSPAVRDAVVDKIMGASGMQTSARPAVDAAPLVAQLDSGGSNIIDAISGFKPSVADVTRNPGVAALEYERQSGPNAGIYAQRRSENVDATAGAMDRNVPQGTPGQLRSALETERDKRIGAASDAARTAEGRATAAVEPLTPETSRGERGNAIRSELETARDTARERTSSAYENANVNDVVANPADLRSSLDNVTESLTQAERALVPQGLIDRVRRLGETPAPVDTGLVDEMGQPIVRREATPDVRLKEATDLKSELQRLQRAALADPKAENGGRNAARVLGQYVDALDGYIGDSLTPDQRTALQTARGAAFEEKQSFGRKGDPAAAMLARGEGGVPRLTDERVARAAASTDDAVARLLEEADTPATRRAIRDELLSNANTGTAADLRKFQQKYAPQIARFQGLNAEIGGAIRARVAENSARGNEGAVLKDIGEQGKGVVAKYLQYGDENAQKAMRGVLDSKDPAKSADQLLTFVNDDPKAVEGARKVFWDMLQKETRSKGSTTATVNGTQPYLPAQLKAFVDDPAKAAVAARLYRDDPGHWANIQKIADALQGVDLRLRARAPNSSGTPQSLNLVDVITKSAPSAARYATAGGLGYLAGGPVGSIISTLATAAGRRISAARSAAIDTLLDKALLDPQLASALLKENNPANRSALRRGGWLGQGTGSVFNMIEPEDQDDETKRAIMSR